MNKALISLACFVILVGLSGSVSAANTTYAQNDLGPSKAAPEIDLDKLNKVRLPFIENNGQMDQEVKFYTTTFAGGFFVTENFLMYTFINESQGMAVKESFLTQKALLPRGLGKSDTVVNYFVGERENWRSNIPTYNSIALNEVWPLIDVELRAYGKNVEKVFKVMPGGKVGDIKLAFEGVRNLKLGEEGELLLETELGTVVMAKPVAFQDIHGFRKLVDGTTYGFVLGHYDPNYILVIDPLLASTFIGGSGWDEAYGIALDGSGNVFIAGSTRSSDYPTTPGAYDTSFNGNYDAFVSKLDSSLSSTPINNPPNPPTSLSQLRSDGATEIPEGGTTAESTVIFKGTVSDPDNDQVKLQVELRRLDEYNGEFLNEPTNESEWVNSGEQASIAVYGLVDGDYH